MQQFSQIPKSCYGIKFFYLVISFKIEGRNRVGGGVGVAVNGLIGFLTWLLDANV